MFNLSKYLFFQLRFQLNIYTKRLQISFLFFFFVQTVLQKTNNNNPFMYLVSPTYKTNL